MNSIFIAWSQGFDVPDFFGPSTTGKRRCALIAHFAVGDGPEAWGFAAGTGVLWGMSYFFWRRLEATPARA